MTVNRTTLLDLPLPVTGTESGTWGDTTNNGLTQYLDIAIAGTLVLSTDADVTLTSTEGDSSATNIGATTAQYAILRWTATGSTTRNITALAQSKTYVVINATGGTQSIVLRGAGPTTGVTIISGEKALCVWNGSDFVKVSSSAAAGGSNTQVQYNSSGVLAGSSNMTFDGTSLTLGGNPTLSAGTANGVLYLNGSKVATSGSALTFDGTNFSLGGTSDPFGRGYGRMFGFTSSGSAGLEINAATGNSAVLDMGVNGTRSLSFTTDGTTPYINVIGALPLGFAINGSEQMRLTSTGLGIGTSSPTQKLEVNGAALVNGSTGFLRVAVTGSPTSGAAALQISVNSVNARTLRMENTAPSGRTYDIINGAAGVAGNLGIYDDTAGAYRVTLDSSGNLGLGVTPSGWDSAFKNLQIGGNGYSGSFYSQANGSSQLGLVLNAYYNAGWKYAATASTPASRYQQDSGQHYWYTAPSGTAGNAITFTQAMTLDASGNLGIGTSSPAYRLQVQSAGTGTTAASNIVGRFQTNGSGYDVFVQLSDNVANSGGIGMVGGAMYLANGTTRNLTLDSSGNLGLGVTPSAWQWAAFQTQRASLAGGVNDRTDLAQNYFRNGGANQDQFIGTGYATLYRQISGQHQWQVSTASGSAGGAITFTQAMTLDASGNLLVGATGQTTGGEKVLVSNYSDNNSAVKLGIYAGAAGNKDLDFYSNGNSQFFTAARIRVNGDSYTDTGYMSFWTTSNNGSNVLTTAERARITSGGDLLVGVTNFTDAGGGVAVASGAASENVRSSATSTGAWGHYGLYNSNGRVGLISTNGTATTYATSSDYRLKDNPQPLTNSGAFIDALQPKTWEWKTDGSRGVGFIAHEVQAVSPASVVGEKDAVDADGKPIMQAMEYGSAEFIANVIAELQSLRQRVALLEGN